MVTLGQTIPALPVRDVAAAADLYRDRLGFDILHPVPRDGLTDTDFGSREFAAVDLDGNLVTFFHWETP